MPPWQSMTPQQQQMLLQLMMNRGTAGMQLGGQAQFGVNPLTSQGAAASPMMGQANPSMINNPALLQYLLGQNGGAGLAAPSLAQLLAMRGGGMGL